MHLLDWPAVCSQVACFAATPMAADQLLQSGLPMGASQVCPEKVYIDITSLCNIPPLLHSFPFRLSRTSGRGQRMKNLSSGVPELMHP